jgi:dolichyl-phosphate-mannose--protein O-mannosyl transferase
MEAVFGTLVIPLLYLLALRIWPNRLFAVAAATLACFDGMFFIQSRIGMIDIYPIFFILLSYWLFHIHLQSKTARSSLVTLLVTGVAVGLAIAAKWIALAALASMLFILAVRFLRRNLDLSVMTTGGPWVWGRSEAKGPAIPGGAPAPLYLGLALVAFLAIPAVIYVASWLPFFERGQFHNLADLWAYQVSSYEYHAHLTQGHPYGSPWYSWPFLFRPVAYYFVGTDGGLGTDAISGQPLVAGMVNLGNPWIWWSSIPCMLLMPYYALRYRSYAAAFIAIGFITQYLPWAPITRVLFLYHMFGGLIFMILALAYVLARIGEGAIDIQVGPWAVRQVSGRLVPLTWLAIAIGFFIFFYPVWTGLPIGDLEYLKGFGTGRMWFPTWI